MQKHIERKTLVFHQIKKFINYTSRATLQQKIVLQFRYDGNNGTW